MKICLFILMGLFSVGVFAVGDVSPSVGENTEGANAVTSKTENVVNTESLESLEALKGRLDEIKTLSGRFEQVIKDNKGNLLQASQGEFSLKRPGYFLWVSEEPFPQTVVGTPDTLKMYDPDLEQLTTYPRGTNDQNNPAHLLSGDLTALSSAFLVVEDVTPKKGETVFNLQPLKSDTPYKEIVFRFKKDKLSGLTFWDKLDQTTEIAFNKLKFNKSLKDTLFDFSAPEGTDLIVNE